MKKLVFLVIALVFVLTGCGNNSNVTTLDSEGLSSDTNYNSHYLNLIYQNEEEHQSADPDLNDKNVISSLPTYYNDTNAKKKITVKINGAYEELIYSESLYYQVGNETLHLYLVNGESGKTVLIDENERICSLSYNFAVIEIDKFSTPEKVLDALKDALDEYVDLSHYEYTVMPNDKSEENDGSGFGRYYFVLYNSINGYRTDWMKVSVKDDGRVSGFNIIDFKYSINSLTVDERLEKEMLELKFKDMFTTGETEFISYSLDERHSPQLVIIDDKLCIEYCGSAKYLHKESGFELNSYLKYVYVPIEIIGEIEYGK